MFTPSLDVTWIDIDPQMTKETTTCDTADDYSA